VLFPLGFLLYRVNDIADAEADRRNPRKGTFLFGSRGAAEQLAALKMADCRSAIAVSRRVFLCARDLDARGPGEGGDQYSVNEG
jgi:hypothetical protein